MTGGTGAATWQGYDETSNSVIARVPHTPRLTLSQKDSRPTPKVETTPMPEITTRRVSSGHYNTGRMTTSQVSATPSAIAWGGGVAFAVSLLWCFLAILFGMPESGVPDTPALTFGVINFVLFTLFAAHHSLFARTGIKRWITLHVPPELERSTYVWISSLLLILVCIAWRPLPGVAYVHYGAAAIVHWLIVVAGFWLTFRSASVLDPLVLAGIRQATGQEFTSELSS